MIISDKNTAEALIHNFSKDELQFQNIYCIGRRTKRFISNTIGEVKKVEKSDCDLIAYLINHMDGNELTYFGHESLSSDLQTLLLNQNITVQSIKAYDIKSDGLKTFVKFKAAIFDNNWTLAASELIDSHYCNDEVARCQRN